MKKFSYLTAAAVVMMAMTTACGSKNATPTAEEIDESQVVETFDRHISFADNGRGFSVMNGDATIAVYASASDSANVMVSVPVCYYNCDSINKVNFVTLTLWHDVADGQDVKVFSDLHLPDDQLDKVLQMNKAAVPNDTVMYQFYVRLPKTVIDGLRASQKLSTLSRVDKE